MKETKEKKVSKKAVKTKKTTAVKGDATKRAVDSKEKVVAEDGVAKDATAKSGVAKETKAKKVSSKAKTSKAKGTAKKTKESISKTEVKEEETTVVPPAEGVTEEAEKAKVEPKKDVVQEVEEIKAKPSKESKKTKENNAKLEASIAKLKGEKNIEPDASTSEEEVAKSDASVSKETTKSDTRASKKATNSDDSEEIIIDAPKTNSANQKRKEKLEEQAELLEKKKKRKSTIITTSIIAALIVIIVVVIVIIGSLNSTTIESHDFYQWYSGQRVEYKGELTFTRKEGLTELKATDRKVTLDSTPVYYSDEKGKVIFPEDMAIVYPNNNGMMYRINHFADIIEHNGEMYLETNLATKTNRTRLENAFLYDGQDLYFFLERTNITVNGTTYEVSPLSYVIVRYKESVEIYNYEKDEYQIIDTTETQDAKIITDTYTVNMSVDSLQTAEKEQLLIKGLSYLQQFGEEINK